MFTGIPTPIEDEFGCTDSCCNCGYIQFESLIPYLADLKSTAGMSEDGFIDLEFKLRQQILEVSRLFDMDANVRPGYFSKAHYRTTRVYSTNGTQFLKIPPFVPGTLEVRTMDDVIVDPFYYSYDAGFLKYLPCSHPTRTTGCYSCSSKRAVDNIRFPDGCYKMTARWGAECADSAVQGAVRDFLIERFRIQTDPVQMLANGIPFTRTFKVPQSWTIYIQRFTAKRRIFSQYGIA